MPHTTAPVLAHGHAFAVPARLPLFARHAPAVDRLPQLLVTRLAALQPRLVGTLVVQPRPVPRAKSGRAVVLSRVRACAHAHAREGGVR